MSVFRVDKTKNYTVMANYHLKDKKLSLKAKGLLSVMLSLPDNWDYSLNGLCAICKEKMDCIRSVLKELEENFYLIRERKQDDKGLFGYEYLIYEQPYRENPYTDNPHTEKPIQLNTKELSTKNKDKLDKNKLNPFTDLLIKRRFIKKNDMNLYHYDDLFNKVLNVYEYKDIIKATCYTIERIVSKGFIDEHNITILNLFGYFKEALLNNLEKITSDVELDWSNDNDE